MDLYYEPWPSEGCTLAEARERTADTGQWRELERRIEGLKGLGPIHTGWRIEDRESAAFERRGRNRLKRTLQELQRDINGKLRAYLQNRSLIAFGRKGGLDAPSALIDPDLWPALPNTDWKISAVGEGRRGGTEFFAVRVFPVLKAPNALDFVSGLSLVEAFRRFILDDPEIDKLGKQAIKLDARYKAVFVGGRCGVLSPHEWPVNWPNLVDISPDDRSIIGSLSDPPPRAICRAEAALADRITCLLEFLRSGDLAATGIPHVPNLGEKVPRTVWSHPDFYFDALQGDVLAIDPDCEEPPRDMLQKRWSGILLERGDRLGIAPTHDLHSAPSQSARGSGSRNAFSSRATRSRAAYAAICELGIDLGDENVGNTEIANKIADSLNPPARTASQVASLAKLIGRLRQKNLDAKQSRH